MALTHDHVRSWAEHYRVAWLEADSEAVSAIFSTDASYRASIYEEPHRGRNGIEAYWREVTSVQSEVDVRVGNPVVDGQSANVEFWTTMRIDGAPVTLAGCLLLRFDDSGLCSDLREYWNFESGTHLPPQDWGV